MVRMHATDPHEDPFGAPGLHLSEAVTPALN
jgi:hypothetical protein